MNIRQPDSRYQTLTARAILSSLALLVLLTGLPANAFAQRSVTHKYPAQKNVRFEMKNISGTITVESWERNEIQVTAVSYSPSAQITPEQTPSCLGIDLVRDNRGKMVGDVNFRVKVPVNSTVNIETRRGNISINNIRGEMVRARVSTSGDIDLTGIRVNQVIAESGEGNILFDGELTGGSYTLKSISGDINIRIPENSSFSLVANGPSKSITLNSFASPELSFIGDGRKVFGNVNRGGPLSTLTIFNQKGNIRFIPR
ncbi:MAG: hypothetical protein QOJ64_2233 [Acidobacteriota bacterium]|jgi:predicted HicB family RNase H-like nuclease|nr:hypothetical protein [Acidobacteriota bacterium]